MSDQSPPPAKLKPGSLRDRIAAFEKSSSSAAPAPAPAPRPKPAGFQSWKPKVPSPPSSPSAAATEHASTSTVKAGGMSASDAKESITKAGSLKERMAALQGKGAFGAPPPIAPKPVLEKPKWKPPPVVHAPVDVDDPSGETSTADVGAAAERTISPPSMKLRESVDSPKILGEDEESTTAPAPVAEGDNQDDAAPVDPEEEERQRRAAIAARMARLGGARVGMPPPVFGKKPPIRRPTQESEENKHLEESKPAVSSPEASKSPKSLTDESLVASSPTEAPSQADTTHSPASLPMRKNSENISILSSDSAESQPIRNPVSMPVPAAPRRAGPPRKKPTKAVPPPPHPLELTEAEANPLSEDSSAEQIAEGIDSKLQAAASTEFIDEKGELPADIEDEAKSEVAHQEDMAPKSNEPALVASHPTSSLQLPLTESSIREGASGMISPPSLATPLEVEEDEDEEASQYSEEIKEKTHIATPVPSLPHSAPAEVPTPTKSEKVAPAAVADEEDTEEADDEARKKHVAERIAKMGGINPFASPPVRGVKSSSELSQSSPPPPPSAIPLPSSLPPAAISQESQRTPKEVPDSKVEEELSDEDEGEDGFSEPSEQHEKPKAPMSPHVESQYEHLTYGGTRPSPSVPSFGTRPPAHVPQPVEDCDQEDEEEGSGEEFAEEAPFSRMSNPRSPEIPLRSSPSQHSHRASPPARPAQPPRRIIPRAPESNTDEDEAKYTEQESDEDVDERLAQSHLFIPPPATQRNFTAVPSPRRHFNQDEEDGDGSENDTPALPHLQRRSMEVSPPRARSPPSDYDSDQDSDHDGRALPVLPRHNSGPPPRVVPPLSPHHAEEPAHHAPSIRRTLPSPPTKSLPAVLPHSTPGLSVSESEEILDDEEGDPIDPSFHSPSRHASANNLYALAQAHSEFSSTPTASSPPLPPVIPSPPPAPPHVVSSPPAGSSMHSPPSRPVVPSPPLPPPSHTMSPETPDNNEEALEQDPELLRRKTIAERMAKLGGIRFGAAPPSAPTHRSPPPPPPPPQDEPEPEESAISHEEPTTEISEEDQERERRERISAKLANMGGMRIGMMPMGMGTLPHQKSHVLREEDVSRSPPQPPAPAARAVPPARPPPPPAQLPQLPQAADTDSEYGSAAASEDGVKVEAEESELEEVTYDDVKEDEPEEMPPPVPSRVAHAANHRQNSGNQTTSPTTSSFRPPVPTSMPVRRSSVQTTRSASTSSVAEPAYNSPPRKRSSFMPPVHSEYVMVEEPESQEPPPPPPARPTSRFPPARTTPSVPQPPTLGRQSTDPSESISSQWELPSIPMSTLDFGGGADLSLSWTDAGEASSPTIASHAPRLPPKPQISADSSSSDQQQQSLSVDDLMTLWGRVGVQVCEVATTMFEKSKKALIGDGTYAGFVEAVFAAVPNAAVPQPTNAGDYSFGYLVYLQNGVAVQKRASDIMPGDVVEIVDAKFKGHKGLQTYHQNVGAGGQALVGVVGEFEAKKTKIRVFHANQHVGQQAVESVSYRLEDLKSGVVKVYRVLEA